MMKFLILTFTLLSTSFVAAQDRVLRDVNTIIMKEPSPGSNTVTYVQQSLAASLTFNLPVADGTNGQVLSTNGSGDLSWATVATVPVNATTDITGILPLAAGGTSKSLTAVNGGVLWTDSNSVEVSAAGNAGQLLLSGGAATPTWSNTVDGLIVDNGVSIIEEASLTNPSAGQRKLGLKTDGKLYLRDSSGNEKVVGEGSAGGINYILNPDAETDTTGWSTYADAAGTSPVDGTGGSPATTWARSTSSPIRSTGSFILTKSANDRQGEGVSYAFSIASGDQAKVMAIEFSYNVVSGTFVPGTNSTSSDMTWWIYDVTNATLIQPSTFKMFSLTTTGSERFIANFQTAPNSTSYRLIGHIGSTSASEYTLKFDDFHVGPAKYAYGTPITDWETYTPTFNNQGTVSSQFFQARRVGSSGEIRFRYTAGTSASGSAATFTLPSGWTCSSTGNTIVGYAWSQTSVGSLYATCGNGATTVGFIDHDGAGGGLTGSDVSTFILDGFLSVKVSGWGATTQMSDVSDGRTVSFHAGLSGAQTGINTNSSEVKVTFNSVTSDSHGGFSTANNRYVVIVPGTYQFCAFHDFNGGSNVLNAIYNMRIKINGSTNYIPDQIVPVAASAVVLKGCTPQLPLKAGDYAEVYVFGAGNNSSSTYGISTSAYFTGARLGGMSSISATEVIAVSANKTSGSQSSNNSWQIIGSWTETVDTHTAFDASAGTFTAPAAGLYQISAGVAFVANSTGARGLRVTKNGSITNIGDFGATAATYAEVRNASGLLRLSAGDVIAPWAFQDSGGSLNYGTAGDVGPFFSIVRVGL